MQFAAVEQKLGDSKARLIHIAAMQVQLSLYHPMAATQFLQRIPPYTITQEDDFSASIRAIFPWIPVTHVIDLCLLRLT